MRDYQKLYPQGRLYVNGAVYFLLSDQPSKPNGAYFCPINAYSFDAVSTEEETATLKEVVVEGVKKQVWIYPSPFVITFTPPFVIEWDAPDFILCRPTGAQPNGEE